MTNNRYRNYYLDGCSHFCTASVVQYLPLLASDQVCHLVLDSWNRQRRRYAVRVESFVIMPEHVHLVVKGTGDGVRKFMQYSLAETSRGIQRVLETRAATDNAPAAEYLAVVKSRANGACSGKVWKERFRALPIDKERDLLVKVNYIHDNPVRRGLVTDPGEWPWSSHGFYYGSGCLFDVDRALTDYAAGGAPSYGTQDPMLRERRGQSDVSNKDEVSSRSTD